MPARTATAPVPTVTVGADKRGPKGPYGARAARTRGGGGGADASPAGSAPAKGVRLPASSSTNRQAMAAFETEKQRLIAKFQKKRSELERRGVFDHHANTIRAENMLHAALGRMKLGAICKASAQECAATAFDAAAATKSRGQGGAGTAATMAQSQASPQPSPHGPGADQDSAAASAAAAAAAAATTDGKSDSTLAALQTQLDESLAALRSISTDTAAGRIQKDLTLKQIERVRRLQAEERGRRGLAAAAGSSSASGAGDTAAQSSPAYEGQHVPQHMPRSSEGSVSVPLELRKAASILPSTGGGTQPPALGRRAKGGGNGQAAQRRRGGSHDPEVVAFRGMMEVYREGAGTEAVHFSAAEWMQKQWEHLRYSPVETRFKRRAKQADDRLRPSDVVARYTEPRRWMTSAAKAQASESGGGGGGGGGEDGGSGGGGGRSLLRRDSDMALPTGTGASTHLWERNAAVLSVENMLHSPSLAEIVDVGLVANSTAGKEELHRAAAAASAAKVATGKEEDAGSGLLSRPTVDAKSVDLASSAAAAASGGASGGLASPSLGAGKVPPHPRHLIFTPGFHGKEKMRELYKETNQVELLRQKRVVHSAIKLHEGLDVEGGGGGGSGGGGAGVLDDLSEPEDDVPALPPVPVGARETEKRTLDLLEGVVAFLCREFALRRVGRGHAMSAVKVLRNLLGQCLKTLLPLVSQQLQARGGGGGGGGASGREMQHQQGGGSSGILGGVCAADESAVSPPPPPPLPAASGDGFETPEALQHRLVAMRTWSKGAEVLLTWDLALTEPFTTASEAHLSALVRYYVGIQRKIHRRLEVLVRRWRSVPGGGGDAAQPPVPSDASRFDGVFASTGCYEPPRERSSYTREEWTRVRETQEQKASIARALGEIAVDGSDPKTAHAVRQFMEKLGFLPQGGGVLPAGGNGTSAQRLREKVLASSTTLKRLLDERQRQATPQTEDGEEEEEEDAGPPVRTAAQAESDAAAKGAPATANLYFGTVLCEETSVHMVTVDVTRAHSSKTEHGVVEDQSARAKSAQSPYKRGTLLLCIAREGEWVQMRNGYYVRAADVVQTDDARGQVLQHSADNTRMRTIVGAKEARQRQKAQILNNLMTVVTQYLRLSSHAYQARFVECVKEETRRPPAAEDESRLDRLLSYDPEDCGGDDFEAAERAETEAKEAQVRAEAHRVTTDMLLRRYGARYATPARLKRQQVLDNPSMWAASYDPSTQAAVVYSDALEAEAGQKEAQQQPAAADGHSGENEKGGDGGGDDAANSDSDASDTQVPSLTSSLSDDGAGGVGSADGTGPSESVLKSKCLGELDRVLQGFKWTFQRRHDIGQEWEKLSSRELRQRVKLWKRCQSVHSARSIAHTNLVKKLDLQAAILDAPHVVSKMCSKFAALGLRLQEAAQSIKDMSGDTVLIEGVTVPEMLDKESAAIHAAVKKAKNTPASEMLAQYFEATVDPVLPD